MYTTEIGSLAPRGGHVSPPHTAVELHCCGTGDSWGVGRTGSGARARGAVSGYKAKRSAGERAGRLVDTLRSVCKAAIDNILQVHPVFLRVLTSGTWKEQSGRHLCLTHEKRCWREGRDGKGRGGCLGSDDIILACSLSEAFTIWPGEPGRVPGEEENVEL